MAILNGIILKGSDEVHKLNYNEALANLPKLVKSWNDLGEKPFYEEITTLSYDGNYENYEYVQFSPQEGMTAYYIKMSDEVLSTDKLIGSEVSIYAEGTLQSNIVPEDAIVQQDGAVMIGDIALMVTEDSYTLMEGLTFTKGIWFGHLVQNGSTVMYTKSFAYGTMKYLDSKFIKDMYSSKEVEVDLLAKQDLSFSLMQDPIYGVQLTEFNALENDTTYLVEWDGTIYECVSVGDITDTQTEIYLGDMSLTGGSDMPDTEEPFLMVYARNDTTESFMIGTLSTETSHNIRIYQKTETVTQIPSKYVDAYSKAEIDTMLGTYIDEVDVLLGGAE